jgi:hypothetical protein
MRQCIQFDCLAAGLVLASAARGSTSTGTHSSTSSRRGRPSRSRAGAACSPPQPENGIRAPRYERQQTRSTACS